MANPAAFCNSRSPPIFASHDPLFPPHPIPSQSRPSAISPASPLNPAIGPPSPLQACDYLPTAGLRRSVPPHCRPATIAPYKLQRSGYFSPQLTSSLRRFLGESPSFRPRTPTVPHSAIPLGVSNPWRFVPGGLSPDLLLCCSNEGKLRRNLRNSLFHCIYPILHWIRETRSEGASSLKYPLSDITKSVSKFFGVLIQYQKSYDIN
ncbi:2-Cys peroxiredoxin BAS1, chloroplastic-like [Canna indica]|uniref:2-Cys peroxiredoxin BAS1, chloroplastic-like n=1 Tax=Canna indica TaxID=4628 RepID=A0AAQ3JV40_9LILI|nr:2-Cys peroxiredoxin BAS1, chloroplastic-like [Canna indica]